MMTLDANMREVDTTPVPGSGNALNVFGLSLSVMSDEEAQAREEQERQEEVERKREKLLAHYRSDASGVPERYRNESLDTYRPWSEEAGAALNKVRAFVGARQERILLLCGAPGTGKTHLGCGIIRERGGVYRSMLRLMYEVDGTMSYKARKSKVDLLDEYCYAPMLVLDELGRCGVREDMQKELVGYLVGERYANSKPTVLITNFGKQELAKWLGLAVFDRLNETGESFEFKGGSYRLQKRSEHFGGDR